MLKKAYYFFSNCLNKNEKLQVIYGIFLIFIFILYSTSLPYIFKVWIDESILNKNETFFLQTGIILFITSIIAIFFDWYGAYLLIKVRESSRKNIRISLLNKIYMLELKDIEKFQSGYLTQLLLNDVECATGMLISFIFMIVPAVSSLPISIYWSFKLSKFYAIIGVIGFILIFLNIYFFSNILRKASLNRQDCYSKTSGIFQENISGYFLIKLNQMQNVITQRNKSILNNLENASVKKHSIDYASSIIETFITSILQIISIFICILFVLKYNENYSTASIMAGIFYLLKIWSPIHLLSSINGEIQESVASMNRIENIIDKKINFSDNTIKNNIIKLDEIKAENLFLKIEDKTIINNLNFIIKSNQKVGIQGKSGSGKTTLIKAILGFYNNYDGTIKINNNLISNYENKDILENIGYMSQDIFLFRENLFFNISLNFDFDEGKLIKIIDKVNLNELYNNLKNNQLIPEQISGGEKKRIGIARLLYQDKTIIILDEPFSGLDQDNKADIYDKVFKNFKNNTIILISHIEEDFKNCETIITI